VGACRSRWVRCSQRTRSVVPRPQPAEPHRASRTSHSAAVHVPGPGNREDRSASACGVEAVSPLEAETWSRTKLGLLENEVGVGFALNRNPNAIVGGARSLEARRAGDRRWLHLHVRGRNGRVAGGEAARCRAELAAGGVVAGGCEPDAVRTDVLRIDLALDD